MVALLPIPTIQYADANGKPYEAGTINTYVPGTTTPKSTWKDPLAASLNTNPIVLDSAGRCVVYADGAVRLVLRDVLGNLIFDLPSDTIVSAAMQPVMSAPTIADAKNLLGISADINAAVAAEAATRAAQDANLQTNITNESNARYAADNILSSNLSTETSERMTEDANLQSQISALPTGPPANNVTAQTGTSTTNGAGLAGVAFGAAFPHYAVSFVVNPGTPGTQTRFTLQGITASGANGLLEYYDTGTTLWTPMVLTTFTWYASGY